MMYFNLSSAIVDRVDLTIEEKMACVVLARYANNTAFDGLITLDVFAKKMGVSVEVAGEALKTLSQKGLIDDFDELRQRLEEDFSQDQLTKNEKSKVVSKADADHLKAPNFETFIPPKTKRSVTDQEIADVFEEIIPKSRLNILFGLAGEDIDVLKRAYKEVKQTHKYDVIDALAEYLQNDSSDNLAAEFNDLQKNKVAQEAYTQTLNPLSPEEARETLDYDEAKALLDLLENDITPDDISIKGQNLNKQINLGKVQSAYKAKLKK